MTAAEIAAIVKGEKLPEGLAYHEAGDIWLAMKCGTVSEWFAVSTESTMLILEGWFARRLDEISAFDWCCKHREDGYEIVGRAGFANFGVRPTKLSAQVAALRAMRKGGRDGE